MASSAASPKDMEAHAAIVQKISQRVAQFHSQKKPFRIYHGSTNSTRQSTRTTANTVDTSALNRVLSIDTANLTVTTEPNVGMGPLVEATLKHGLIPPVVMEFQTITAGGGFSGSSGESSSFRHGAFEANVVGIEIVLPDGTVTKASRTEKPDLLWGAASAFGTIGVVTLVEVKLRPCKAFVELRYIHCKQPQDYVELIKSESEKPDVEYLDGIVYARDSTVICSGRFIDAVPKGKKSVGFTGKSDTWFYLRAQEAETKLKAGKTEDEVTDYIPIRDYLFRFNRGGFWTARYAFKYFVTPFNRITRRVLDRFMQTSVMYHAMHKSGLHDYYVIQDVGVPYSRAAEFHNWLDDTYKMYPIWLCPLRIRRDEPNSNHGLHAEFNDPNTESHLLNYGVWGPVPGDRKEVVRLNRLLEHKVQECGGKKWLYSHAYYTEEEFWAHYDRGAYDAVRERYGAGHLPSVFDKTRVDWEKEEAELEKRPLKKTAWKIWPLRGLYGVYHAWSGREYLLQKGKTQDEGVQPKVEKKAEMKDAAAKPVRTEEATVGSLTGEAVKAEMHNPNGTNVPMKPRGESKPVTEVPTANVLTGEAVKAEEMHNPNGTDVPEKPRGESKPVTEVPTANTLTGQALQAEGLQAEKPSVEAQAATGTAIPQAVGDTKA